MILKTFELSKKKEINGNFFLLYGENEGYQNEIIKNILLKNSNFKQSKYDEKEIIDNYEEIVSSILNKSFFENEKILIINRVTDKIISFIDEISSRKIDHVKIVLKSGILEKKSKLRNFFEKDKKLICIPFYSDDYRTLASMANIFFKEQKISISNELVNLIVDRCNGNRGYLKNELNKIKLYLSNKKNINLKEILYLTNLTENFFISDLVDNCLSQNLKRLIKILNENNYGNEDCILIIRTFLAKAKRLMILRRNYDAYKDIELVIKNYKPPIFWKDKPLVIDQVKKWSLGEVNSLLIDINRIELLIKKSSNNSLNILYDFVLCVAKKTNNETL